jgi:hypothetical protein
MKPMNLLLHCGGVSIDRSELNALDCPEATDTHRPIPHGEFVNMVEDALGEQGLRVIAEAHGVTQTSKNTRENGGGNYFGMFQVQGTNLQDKDHTTVVGMRNSHIKKLSAGVAIGSGVFVCDNLAFLGEHVAMRKHTKNILDDDIGILPLIRETVEQVVSLSDAQERRFDTYKSQRLGKYDADHLIVQMLRDEVITTQQLPKVVQQWDEPDHEEFARSFNGWRLFNAVTEALKGTSPLALPRRTGGLHRLLDEFLGVDDQIAA